MPSKLQTFQNNNILPAAINAPHQLIFNPSTGVRGSAVTADVGGVATVKQQNRAKRNTPIRKIEDRMKKHVTFSKRRKGLFTKASELCILCGAQVAIITFSGAGKVFTFGHPSADSVIRRYLYGGRASVSLNSASSSTTFTPFTGTVTNFGSNGDSDVTVACHGKANWPVMPYDRDGKDVGLGSGTEIGPKNEQAAQENGAGMWWEEEGWEERLRLEELQVYLEKLEEVRNKVLMRLLDFSDLPKKSRS